MEYNFYSLRPAGFSNTFARLIEKIYTSGKRAVVSCNSEEKMADLNRVLWTFSVNSFIPHGDQHFGFSKDQPVYFTTGIENPNSAQILVLVDSFIANPWSGFDFEKIIFAFSDDAEASNRAEKVLLDLKKINASVNYWQQTSKSWESRF